MNEGPLQRHILNKKPLKMFEIMKIAPEEAHVLEDYEISINYGNNREKLDQNKVVINNIFAFQVALAIIRNDEDPKPQNVEEC